jgi:hypothetical protein
MESARSPAASTLPEFFVAPPVFAMTERQAAIGVHVQ